LGTASNRKTAPKAYGLAAQAASLCSKFDSGPLHFAIRQEPDERFIVKIDNLDVVAPGIVKIAAEWRLKF
jgi:hypothetical protein